jgi:hypothetical protein
MDLARDLSNTVANADIQLVLRRDLARAPRRLAASPASTGRNKHIKTS